MRHLQAGVFLLFFLFLLLSLSPGCAERERVFPSEPTTASGYLERGWRSFEQDSAESAARDFSLAVELDSTLGEAHLGLGWARLALAESELELKSARESFNAAIAAGHDESSVRSGRAATSLGLGEFAEASSDAASVESGAPQFVFAHRTSFNHADVLLIQAFAAAGAGDLDSVLSIAKRITDPGILPGDPLTWVVGEVTYSSYPGAILAFLAELSEEFSG